MSKDDKSKPVWWSSMSPEKAREFIAHCFNLLADDMGAMEQAYPPNLNLNHSLELEETYKRAGFDSSFIEYIQHEAQGVLQKCYSINEIEEIVRQVGSPLIKLRVWEHKFSLRQDGKRYYKWSDLAEAAKQNDHELIFKQRCMDDYNEIVEEFIQVGKKLRVWAAGIQAKATPVQAERGEKDATFSQKPLETDFDYEKIISIISKAGQAMGRSGSAQSYAAMKEGQLRDQLLVALKGHYGERASAETSSVQGRTDIFIILGEAEEVFIGECKIWRGEREFEQAIDQLLGYTLPPDSKTALIVFNHNRNTSEVLAKIKAVVKGHKNFKRIMKSTKSRSSFRYAFQQPRDRALELTLTVLVIYLPNTTKGKD